MQYSSSSPAVRTIDVSGTPTVNAEAYRDSDSYLRLNGQGLPVAIRHVTSARPGSFVRSRFEVVTPKRAVALSPEALRAWEDRRGHPVN